MVKKELMSITFACGHTVEVDLIFRTDEDGLDKLAYLETQQCNACQNDEFEDFHDLAQLTGSPKQIGWARTLRRKMLENAQSIIQEAEEAGLNLNTVNEGYAGMLTKLEAKWWIDSRNKIMQRLLLAKYIQKVCPACGQNFSPKTSNQKYCNIKCRNHAALLRDLTPEEDKVIDKLLEN